MPDWIRERFEPLLLGGDRVRDVGNVVKLDADAARAPLTSTESVSPQPETVTSAESARPALAFETSFRCAPTSRARTSAASCWNLLQEEGVNGPAS